MVKLAQTQFYKDSLMIKDLITKDAIFLDSPCESKQELLSNFAKEFAHLTFLSHYKILESLLAREALQSTAMGHGIAIPHCIIKDYNGIFTGFVRTKTPIDFESLDTKPCDLFFFIVASQDSGADYLRVLARTARLLRDETIRNSLRSAETSLEIFQIFS